jgi:hypothetical protein
MSKITTPKNERSATPDVSLGLEHIHHYLVLADQQHEQLHGQLRDKANIDVSNRLGWLLSDLQDMVEEVQATLYPADQQAADTNKGA